MYFTMQTQFSGQHYVTLLSKKQRGVTARTGVGYPYCRVHAPYVIGLQGSVVDPLIPRLRVCLKLLILRQGPDLQI